MIFITSYVGKNLAELQTLKTALEAEKTRQLVAGATFGQPGGRTRGGINYETLVQELQAVDYAIAAAQGTRVDQTIADVSDAL